MIGRDEVLRVFTAFSGYDSQCMALDRIGVNYELVGWSEIDPNAIAAHNAVYPQWADRNAGDISKIDWGGQPDFDLFTYSSPCQDFSNAGRMAGGEEGSGTRSSLLWECRKAIIAKKPKYLLMENVKNLVSGAFRPTFFKWLRELEEYGYTNHYKVLNAKDFGVPQNRERIFVVSIRDEVGCYYFPNPIPLERRIRDIVEEEVDEGYFLSESQIAGILGHCERKLAEGCGFRPQFRGGGQISTAITTRYGARQTDTMYRVPSDTEEAKRKP